MHFSKQITENVTNHRDIKLITTEVGGTFLVSEPNYHTAKIFSNNFLAVALKRTRIIKNKSVYVGLSILEISNIVVYCLVWYC